MIITNMHKRKCCASSGRPIRWSKYSFRGSAAQCLSDHCVVHRVRPIHSFEFYFQKILVMRYGHSGVSMQSDIIISKTFSSSLFRSTNGMRSLCSKQCSLLTDFCWPGEEIKVNICDVISVALLYNTKWFGQIGTIFQSLFAGYQCPDKKIMRRLKRRLRYRQLDF